MVSPPCARGGSPLYRFRTGARGSGYEWRAEPLWLVSAKSLEMARVRPVPQWLVSSQPPAMYLGLIDRQLIRGGRSRDASVRLSLTRARDPHGSRH